MPNSKLRRINRFTRETIENLKHYVYVYFDPETNKPFYVGQGTGNRAFDHLKETNEKEKVKRINAIRRRGQEPKIVILTHGFSSDIVTKHIETAVIDVLGKENLTNERYGLEHNAFPPMEAYELEAYYNGDTLDEDEIVHDCILLRITDYYSADMSEYELYETTRGYWKVNYDKASTAQYALAVCKELIVKVYKIAEWLPAGSTMMEYPDLKRETPKTGEYEFVGKTADIRIQNRYVGKKVSSFFPSNYGSRIKYAGPSFR